MDYTNDILEILSSELEPYVSPVGEACIDGVLTSAQKLNEFLQQKLQKTPCSTSLPPLAEIYSFVQWIASEDFDWHYSETAELWMKDGWRSRTTAELLEFWSRRQ